MSIEAMKQALEAIEELEYSSSTAVADAKARRAKYALRKAIEEAEQIHRPAGLEDMKIYNAIADNSD